MGFVDSLRDIGRNISEGFMSEGQITAACASHLGKRRDNNEDNFFFGGSYMKNQESCTNHILTKEPGEMREIMNRGGLFAVFDGMGGGEYGEVASLIAAEEAQRFVGNNSMVDPHDVTISLKQFCLETNDKIVRTAYDLGTNNMGSTIAGYYLFDDRFWICNLGDSKCYLYREGRLYQMSEDHTDEQEMQKIGITGRKPMLTQYFGIDSEQMVLEPFVKSGYIWNGDVLLVCSDGLTDMVSEEDIEAILKASPNPSHAVNKLVNAALDGGGKDNITVIIICC